MGDDPDRFLTGIFVNLIFWASLKADFSTKITP